jgi:2-polyprenyl-6-methoxyphenol hydroxylase-like FAD-dependent oxidoreductase
MAGSPIDRAVVVGGSIAGLVTAAVLAERGADVVVLDRAAIPAAADRSIAPQGGLPHLLLVSGATALEQAAPGLTDGLLAAGAIGVAEGELLPCHWWAEGGVRRQVPDLGVRAALCSRPLVETTLRRLVLARPDVALRDRTAVGGLHVRDGVVRGVRLADGEEVEADLVVDASGRGTRSPRWLADAGFGQPATERVGVDITYTAVQLPRRPGDVDGAAFAVVQNTARLARLGVVLPMEGDRWHVVLGGYFGDAAPRSREGMLDFAGSLPDPVVRQVLDRDWCGEPIGYRFPFSLRRRWERLADLPRGFAAIGDAVASCNPIYGQGMSSAALQAHALVRTLDRHPADRHLSRRIARATARVAATAWQVATGGDFAYAATTGRRPPGTDLVNRYMARAMARAADDPVVDLALTRVQHLLAPAPSMFAPRVAARVLARAAPRPA